MSEHYIRLYQTGNHPCSYLDGQEASTLFMDPQLQPTAAIAEYMIERGFRRSGRHIYRPHCPNCSACISVRLDTHAFTTNRSQRKVLNRNQDLSIEISDPGLTLENYRLYRRYISARHGDGDMFPPTAKQFQDFLGVVTGYTRFWNFRQDNRLLAVAVTDHFPQSLSTIYCFFDPNEQRRSLGVYAILRQIQGARAQGLPWLYLGYWIDGCRKMSYKSVFTPQQRFDGREWR